MASKNENFFFDSFEKGATIACEAATLLKEILENYESLNLTDKLKQMHEIENGGDHEKHDVMSELVRAFITPIERNDISNLCDNIDNVTDSIEDVLLQLYINNITVIREDAIIFSSIVIQCCKAMETLLKEFRNFKKSKCLNELIIEINKLEEDGDKIYLTAMRELTMTTTNPIEFIAWREIYAYLEKCCDACEDVADVVESIAIGNS